LSRRFIWAALASSLIIPDLRASLGSLLDMDIFAHAGQYRIRRLLMCEAHDGWSCGS